MDIFIIMCLGEVIESTYYTDEDKVAKRVSDMNIVAFGTEHGDIWYKRLTSE